MLPKNFGVIIPEFTPDRHTGIEKWVRKQHPKVAHYFDIWHLARSIGKKIAKAGKEKGCEILLEWLKGIRNHLYWCATSTMQGFKEMIKAKWLPLLRHIADRHDNHDNILFSECAHETLEPRKWIKIGKCSSECHVRNSVRKEK